MHNTLEINQFLACKTSNLWLAAARDQQDILLIDHANCEKKAAAAAMHLMHCYIHSEILLQKMARLAREELLHFQKVLKLMQKRGVAYLKLPPARYAEQLRKEARHSEPERLIDLLIIGAFIEARSCERFAALALFLEPELQDFYQSLYEAEKRHFQDYLQLASSLSSTEITSRVAYFREIEQGLIASPDPLFRFHSGIPV
ncbi:MAG: tRNA hydroxylase [Gammaproteobacteria bacterium RIFCSPHIGHO2_12_FULL_35_23]|nr:MAG: tRNA hydroxylase [Gammaproteobacteria bacterium RIFCSPHIGHO2_12_FULL_35_23]